MLFDETPVRRKSRRVPPSGPRLRRPASEGPRPRPFTYCPAGRVGLRLGVSESASCVGGNGRPSRPAPCGPCPVEALAFATGPEGGTRRLFPTARWIAGEHRWRSGYARRGAGLPHQSATRCAVSLCAMRLAPLAATHAAIATAYQLQPATRHSPLTTHRALSAERVLASGSRASHSPCRGRRAALIPS